MRILSELRLLALAVLALPLGCDVAVTYVGANIVAVDAGSDGGLPPDAGSDGGMALCTPGSTQSCYSGPAGTEGQGICKAGSQTCAADGASWGPCTGEVLPQQENCATPEDEDCDGKAPPCKGKPLWAKRFGDAAIQYATSVATDNFGNIFLAGYFYGSVDFGGGMLTSAGNDDAYVVKLDPDGNHLWSKRFGGAGKFEVVTSLAVDAAGSVLLTGTFSSTVDFGGGTLTTAGGNDAFVAKLDANGNHLWSKRFGDTNGQFGIAVAADAMGNVLVTGILNGATDFGGGPLLSAGVQDIFVLKLDANGTHLWSKRFGDVSDQQATSIAVDAAGNTFLAGFFEGVVDFSGGSAVLTSAGGEDIYVVKLDPAGNHLWSKSFGAAGSQQASSLAVDGTGGVVVTGTFSGVLDLGGGVAMSAGGTDVFLAKLDTNGGYVWAQRFGDEANQQGQSVAVDSGGNVLATGYFLGSLDLGGGQFVSGGGTDAFLVKLDETGSHQWSKRFGDDQDQTGRAVASDGSGNVIVAGYFSGTMDFSDGVTLTSAGSSDIFIAKFSP